MSCLNAMIIVQYGEGARCVPLKNNDVVAEEGVEKALDWEI